jgi:UDP-N-acetylmuramate--alanine ligase
MADSVSAFPLSFSQFYLVGIKGVAMTALAQCLLDAGKHVRGSDVAEAFVTQHILEKRQITVDVGFDHELPPETECVIFTAAHQSTQNPQVLSARQRGLPTLTHAEALAQIFNAKHGLAVCGVGGKSTTSAMIAWILATQTPPPSYAVGVGDILGWGKTGQWSPESQYFVAEADEYVTDPTAPSRGEPLVPRFSFLSPHVIVCTNIAHDHPDVYPTIDDTRRAYREFFQKLPTDGTLVWNADNAELQRLTTELNRPDIKQVTFGSLAGEYRLGAPTFTEGSTTAQITVGETSYQLELPIMGLHNLQNAIAAIAAAAAVGISVQTSVDALRSFKSTSRRAEFIGEKNGVTYFDDYAHHPSEVAAIIAAAKAWYPQRRVVIAFQSHTFTRTRTLFDEFVHAFSAADEVAMIDIFPSAREAFDPEMSSELLCNAIRQAFPAKPAENFKTIDGLAAHLRDTLKPGDVCLTVGAGDIYHVHELLQ